MPAADYITEVLTDTPKAFWELQDASGNPVDSSGNGLHFTSVAGPPTYHVAGPDHGNDYAIEFASGGAYLVRSSPVSTVTNNFTIEAWVNVVAISSGADLVTVGDPFTTGWSLTTWGRGGKFAGLANQIAYLANSSLSPSVGTGTWYHIVIVRDSGTWKYYVNGAVDTANAGTTAPGTPGTDTLVGNARSNPGDTNRLAYVAVYETVLTPTRIAAHYSAMIAFSDSATVYFDLQPSAIDVGPIDDSANVLVDVQATGVDVFPIAYTDSTTVYLDLTTTTTAEEHSTYDAVAVYLDLGVDGGECYSTAQINVEGEAYMIWFADANMVWSAEPSPQWSVRVRRSGVHC